MSEHDEDATTAGVRRAVGYLQTHYQCGVSPLREFDVELVAPRHVIRLSPVGEATVEVHVFHEAGSLHVSASTRGYRSPHELANRAIAVHDGTL